MGQAPTRLQPATSVRHFFGAELRRRRTRGGLSQAELGKLVFVSGDLVRRVETAERFPALEFARQCDSALNAGGALARLWPLLVRERNANNPNDKTLTATDLHRPALDWLLEQPFAPSIDADPTGARVGDDAVAEVGVALDMFRRRDHAEGAGGVSDEVDAYLRTALPRLLTGCMANSVGLYSLAAGFHELRGYQAVDQGVDGLAQRHYLRGLELTRAAGDRLLGGYLLGVSIAHLALHCREPDEALRMAQTAVHGTHGQAGPRLQAALMAVVARARARMGHERDCTRALAASERHLASADGTHEPAWIAYFTLPYLADEKAHCFHDLGHGKLAQQEIADALRTLAPSHTRRLAIDTALLASSLARTGDVERACAVGCQAVDQAASTASQRTTQRIVALRADLDSYASHPGVVELTDYIRTVLPAAA
jgi:transcriptional regulator with XRE-family HTH domain